MEATAAKMEVQPRKVQLWRHYDVKIQIRDRIVGGYPKNPDAEEAMLRARGLEDLIPIRVDPATLNEEEREALKKATVEKSWTGFKTNDAGELFLESRCVKALFKECANILKGPQLLNIKNYKSKLAERVFVEPDEIVLRGAAQPDGTDKRVVHVMTAMGPRSSIKIFDFYKKPEISFQLLVLNDGIVTSEDLRTILEYGQENGLGADRSQGFGKFNLIELSEYEHKTEGRKR